MLLADVLNDPRPLTSPYQLIHEGTKEVSGCIPYD